MVQKLDLARIKLVNHELNPIDIALELLKVLVFSLLELEIFSIKLFSHLNNNQKIPHLFEIGSRGSGQLCISCFDLSSSPHEKQKNVFP